MLNMIKINLLPQELQKKNESFDKTSKKLFFLIPLFICAVLGVHAYLTISVLSLRYQFNNLKTTWDKLEPKRKVLEAFKKEYGTVAQDLQQIEKWNKERVSWSEKLNILSRKLPSGIWFNEISVSPKDFTLKGSVVSPLKQELSLINRFVSNLKAESVFFKDFKNLELGPLQRDVQSGYDIINFTLTGALK